MNILILNWRDIEHPFAGGAEISLFEHAKYWKKNGADVKWFSSNFSKGKSREEIDGIKIYRYGSVYTVHLWAFFYSIKGLFTDRDIVIDCFHFIPYFSILYLKKKKIVVLINEVAGRLWFSNLFFPIAFVGNLLEPYFIKLYRKKSFITGSLSTKKELVKLSILNKNINIVHHGVSVVSIDDRIKKETYPVIVFLGRISKDKGIEDTLRVFRLVNKENKRTKLWIIGKEEEHGKIKMFKNQEFKDIKNNIEYFGFVDEKMKYELLKRAWILIHPSQKEGWGLNVIEAASQGTPTVGTDVEGLRDSIKNDQTGILVPEKDYEAMARAINKLINNNSSYNSMSKACLDWAKKFTWEESTEKSWNILTSVYQNKET